MAAETAAAVPNGRAAQLAGYPFPECAPPGQLSHLDLFESLVQERKARRDHLMVADRLGQAQMERQELRERQDVLEDVFGDELASLRAEIAELRRAHHEETSDIRCCLLRFATAVAVTGDVAGALLDRRGVRTVAPGSYRIDPEEDPMDPHLVRLIATFVALGDQAKSIAVDVSQPVPAAE